VKLALLQSMFAEESMLAEESIEAFSRRVLAGVANGTMEFTGPWGAGDTIRNWLPAYALDSNVLGTDQFGTTVAAYTLDDRDPNDPWARG